MTTIKELPPLPVYNGNSKSDGVIVPLLQAGVKAILIGSLGFFGLLMVYWIGKDFPGAVGEWINIVLGGWWFKLSIAAGLVGFFVTALVEWPARRDHWMWMWEKVWRVDMNGDGVIGEPETHNPQLQIISHDPEDQHISIKLLPYPDRFVEVCRAVSEDGAPLTHEEWVGRRNLFSRPEWDNLTHEMARKGLLKKSGRAANSPWTPTPEGWNTIDNAAADWVRIKTEVRLNGPAPAVREFADNSPTAPMWWDQGMFDHK